MHKKELPGRGHKTKGEVHGKGERGHADSWCETRRCRGQGKMEGDDSLWQLLEKDK